MAADTKRRVIHRSKGSTMPGGAAKSPMRGKKKRRRK